MATVVSEYIWAPMRPVLPCARRCSSHQRLPVTRSNYLFYHVELSRHLITPFLCGSDTELYVKVTACTVTLTTNALAHNMTDSSYRSP